MRNDPAADWHTEVSRASNDAALRAQQFANKAIIHFIESEAKADPHSDGFSTAIGMQLGFLMSIVLAGFAALRGSGAEFSKEYFVEIAGLVFDDAMRNEDDEGEAA